MLVPSHSPGGPRRNIFDVGAEPGPAVRTFGMAAARPASIFDAVPAAPAPRTRTAARRTTARLPWRLSSQRTVLRRLTVVALLAGMLAAVVAQAFSPSDIPADGRAAEARQPAGEPHVSAPAASRPHHPPTQTRTPKRRDGGGRGGAPRRSAKHAQAPRREPGTPAAPPPATPAPTSLPAPAAPLPPAAAAPTPSPTVPPAPPAPTTPPAGSGAPGRPVPAPVPVGAPPQFM
jgi:hypothetical protein